MSDPIDMVSISGREAFTDALRLLGEQLLLVELSDDEIYQRLMVFRVANAVSRQAADILETHLHDRGYDVIADWPQRSGPPE